MRRKGFFIAVCLGLMLLMTACGAKDEGKTEGYKKIVDEYAEYFLKVDEDGGFPWKGYEIIGNYLNGDQEYEEALADYQKLIDTMYERAESIPEYHVDSEMSELLQEYGMVPEEFELFGNFREEWLGEHISKLEFLLNYFEGAETNEYDYEDLKFYCDLYVKLEECERGYFYYACVNYWFAGWSEEQVDYVQEQVISKLQTFYSDAYTWETDREMTEEKAMLVMDEMEKYYELMDERLGAANKDLMQAE